MFAVEDFLLRNAAEEERIGGDFPELSRCKLGFCHLGVLAINAERFTSGEGFVDFKGFGVLAFTVELVGLGEGIWGEHDGGGGLGRVGLLHAMFLDFQGACGGGAVEDFKLEFEVAVIFAEAVFDHA